MSSSIQVVETKNAPAAVGAYSQAIKYNGLVYTSGTIPLDPVSMKIIDGAIEEQTTQVFTNLKAVLEASGASLSSVLKTTVFLKDMNDFPKFNAVYAKYLPNKPARSTVQVARLPMDVLVEIEALAHRQNSEKGALLLTSSAKE
ncbi:uncharacterized protein L969DRAFT_51603 [Mixia osmundae IAM 14324]|uniref:Uncharacterized protein n=1 Tax=Mixia osmundae (strain CBS 9802 / IAM 14324 / JCM 22182 / KY 12970) TaxID=764103 RepID=G7DWW5_MIXOS|nr:uncharacterized protein L969DRAFT_55492 [Mixia osmundae IAM 14324]XP_014566695.1 uncharacterized protein L969DRAFT_51603 [Mixia osmundae IAM 14324]KEI36162.1 hypothetical protein L969DRAFT_55492 [Mixia osmundae IAM 14324]KEI38130.1 hypothetical protein L969DRAFT_51603 [Mixia osmundae IAM 14324]GAA95062.1 hypothetical protein E5Q_01717 [Mixia osmundae IAM 14324]